MLLVAVPFWAVFGLTGVLSGLWVASAAGRRRSARRQAAGLCPACGYDLRATPDKGGALLDRCPECGAVPATAPS